MRSHHSDKKRIGILQPIAPFDAQKLRILLEKTPHPILNTLEWPYFRRVFRQNNQLALVSVQLDETAGLPVFVHGSQYQLDEQALLQQVAYVLGTNVNHLAFWEMVSSSDVLRPILEPVYGIPLLRTASVFEALITVIMEQHIAWKAARRAQRVLIEWTDQSVQWNQRQYFAFPTSAQLANTHQEALRITKITHKRIDLIITLSQAIESGELDVMNLQTMTEEQRYQYLLQIKGVGHWTAAIVAARAFGYGRFVAHNDVALQAAVNRYFFGRNGRASVDEVKQVFAEYSDVAGKVAILTLLRWVFDEY